MTEFNPEKKEILTYGDCLSPVSKITTPEDAKQYLEKYIEYIQKYLNENPGSGVGTAEEIVKSNIGYWAGYGSEKERERIEELFNCAHPVFGSIKENGAPTPEEAFNMGKKLGENKK